MKLNTAQRNKIPNKDFAGSNRSYPIEDENHARNALSRASQFASPAEKARIKAKIHAKYPDIGSTLKKQTEAIKKSMK